MNDTFIEEDPFGVPVHESTDIIGTHTRSAILEIVLLLTDISVFVTCICSAAAAMFLIYILVKFKKVREKSSVFLLHYASCVVADMFLIPIIIFISTEFIRAHWKVVCVFYTLADSTSILGIVVGASIGINWFMENFKSSWIEHIPHSKTALIISCYLLSSVKIVIDIVECLVDFPVFAGYISIIIFCSLLTVIIVINIIIKNCAAISQTQLRTQYLLLVSTYIVTSYVPLLIMHFILVHIATYHIWLELLFSLAKIIPYSGPIVVVYLLGKKNKYFKAAYNRAFKKGVRNYEDEDMDQDSVSFNPDISAQIPENDERNDYHAIVI